MLFHRILRSSIAAILAASVTLLGSQACTTFSTNRTGQENATPAGPSSLQVRIYENRSAVKKKAVFAGTVRSKLLRLDPLPAETVYESAESSWSVPELAPGKYRLEVSQREGPEPGAPEVRHGQETFNVKTGEDVAARIILHDTRGYLWAGLGVAAGVGIAIAVTAALRSTLDFKEFNLSSKARPTMWRAGADGDAARR